MPLTARVSRIVAFLRSGYPSGMPATGHVPLAALLRRRLSSDEITTIASELITRRCWPISATDVGVAITRVTDEMPSTEDVERVQHRLDTIGPSRRHNRRFLK